MSRQEQPDGLLAHSVHSSSGSGDLRLPLLYVHYYAADVAARALAQAHDDGCAARSSLKEGEVVNVKFTSPRPAEFGTRIEGLIVIVRRLSEAVHMVARETHVHVAAITDSVHVDSAAPMRDTTNNSTGRSLDDEFATTYTTTTTRMQMVDELRSAGEDYYFDDVAAVTQQRSEPAHALERIDGPVDKLAERSRESIKVLLLEDDGVEEAAAVGNMEPMDTATSDGLSRGRKQYRIKYAVVGRQRGARDARYWTGFHRARPSTRRVESASREQPRPALFL